MMQIQASEIPVCYIYKIYINVLARCFLPIIACSVLKHICYFFFGLNEVVEEKPGTGVLLEK